MDEVNFETELNIDDAADALLKSYDDEEEAKVEDDAEPEDTEEEVEETPEEDDSDEAEADDDEDADGEPEADEASDDSEVSVTVDGKTTKMKVSALKRLAGQEQALTQRSQTVATQQRQVEAQGLYLAKILEGRYNQAKARNDKYAGVDLFRASRELEAEDFDALRAEKEAASAEFNLIEVEAKEFVQRVKDHRTNGLREQAKIARQEITKQIPDWNDSVYDQVRNYAVSQGMDATTVNELVDPHSIVMIHKAMKFDAQKGKTATVKKKVDKAPTKVVQKSRRSADPTTSKLKAKRIAAARSGDLDDIAELFAAASNQ